MTVRKVSAKHRPAGQVPGTSAPVDPSASLGAIDLNLLIVFDALLRERTLTRAGQRLGLSQPATSHALARLRHMLRDDLFVRTPEGMQPTARAEQMAEPLRSALRTLSGVLQPETFDPASTARDFVVAVNNYAARAVVPPLVRLVGDAAPEVNLDIQPIGMRDILDQLDSGGMDIALSTLVDGGERFRCVRIMDDDYVVLLDKAHEAARQTVFSIELLAQIPHIGITSTGDDTKFIDEALERHGLTRKIAIRVPFLSIVLMLVNSNRLAVVPRRVAMSLARVCPLAVRELPVPSRRIGLSMIWHRRLDNQAAHRWLRDMIKASARN